MPLSPSSILYRPAMLGRGRRVCVRRSPEKKRIFLPWAFAATLALLAAALFGGTPSAEAATNTTFTAEADAQVFSDTPDTNYGSAKTLTVDGSPVRRAYLRFNVSIPQGAVVTRRRLRLYFNTSSSSGFDVDGASK